MDKWEAKYLALSAGIEDPKLIENAESVVELAIKLTVQSGQTFGQAFYGMMEALQFQITIKRLEKENKELRAMSKKSFGFKNLENDITHPPYRR